MVLAYPIVPPALLPDVFPRIPKGLNKVALCVKKTQLPSGDSHVTFTPWSSSSTFTFGVDWDWGLVKHRKRLSKVTS